MITRRAVATITIAIAVTSSYSPGTSARQQSTGRKAAATAPASVIARQLCAEFDASGETAAMSNGRIQWAQRVTSPEASLRAAAFIQRAGLQSNRLFAANGAWTAVFDTDSLTLARHNCATGAADAATSDYRLDRIAISESGEIAAHAANGVTLVHQAGLEVGLVVRETSDTGANDLLWVGRRLVLSNQQRIWTVDANESRYTHTARIDAPQRLDRAVHLNGLTYVLQEGGCVSIYVGASLVPRVERVVCPKTETTAATYLGVDSRTIRLLDADGTQLWEAPRPSIATIRVARGTRAASEVFSVLASASWAQSVEPGSPAPLRRAEWTEFLKKWTVSPEHSSKFAAAFTNKGWGNFHEHQPGISWTGSGFAYSVVPGTELIAPSGRSLSALGLQLRGAAYDAAQAEQILKANSGLIDSLEGRLFDAAWTPIAALSDPISDRPLAFVARGTSGAGIRTLATPVVAVGQVFRKADQTTRTLEMKSQCDEQPAADETLRLALRRGVVTLGLVDASLMEALGNPARIEIAASELYDTACGDGIHYLVIRNAGLRGIRNNTIARLARPEVAGAGNLRYRAADNSTWPVIIDGDIIVARKMPEAGRAASVNRWLNRLFAQQPNLPSVALPVTALEMAVVVPATFGVDSGFLLEGATIFKAETTPAEPRQTSQLVDCVPPGSDLRQMHEEWMEIKRVAAAERTAKDTRIGVAENAVTRMLPVFRRAGGDSMWLELDAQNRLVTLTAAPTDIQLGSKTELGHGNRVASILAAQAQVDSQDPFRGVLSDVHLIWINLKVRPNITQFNKIAEKIAIINVSQRFRDDNWVALETQHNASWIPKLLFVAAAANETDLTHGSPLSWHAPNVLGVDVVSGDKSLPNKATYQSEFVDLVAPGASVPVLDDESKTIKCASGTSYATAYVSAVAAIVAQRAGGSLSPAKLRARLLATARWDSSYFGKVKGGLIDAWRAADALEQNVVILQAGRADEDKVEVTADLGTSPGLVITDGHVFSRGAPSDRVAYSGTVSWDRVLRLTRTTPSSDANHRYRIALIDNVGEFRIVENVQVENGQTIPLRNCVPRTTPQTIQCDQSNTPISKIADYYAARPSIDVYRF